METGLALSAVGRDAFSIGAPPERLVLVLGKRGGPGGHRRRRAWRRGLRAPFLQCEGGGAGGLAQAIRWCTEGCDDEAEGKEQA
jgi:hypothetical protein